MRVGTLNYRRGGLFIAICVGCVFASTAQAQRLEIDRHDHAFGEVYAGTTVEHAFRLTNTGGQPLVIESHRASCASCSSALLSDKTIPPGGTVAFRVSYHAKASPGSHAAVVFIHSNDTKEPIQQVTLALTVVPADGLPRAVCEPAKVDAGVMSLGQRTVVMLALTNPRGASGPLRVKEVAGSPGWRLVGPAPRELAPGVTSILTIEVDAKTQGVISEHVSIATDSPVTPLVAIPVTGYVAAGDGAARPAAASGLRIYPLGEPVALPGAQCGFVRRVAIENCHAAPVRVRFPFTAYSLARAEPEELTIAPGATATAELHLLADQVGKPQTIRMEVDYPVVAPTPNK